MRVRKNSGSLEAVLSAKVLYAMTNQQQLAAFPDLAKQFGQVRSAELNQAMIDSISRHLTATYDAQTCGVVCLSHRPSENHERHFEEATHRPSYVESQETND